MTVTLPTIEDSDLVNKGVLGQADTPGLSTEQMQVKVEEIPRAVIVPKFKDLVTALIAEFSNVFSKAETTIEINNKITEIGAGDMAKAVYDTNLNGVVDNAEKLDGKLPTEFATSAQGTKADTALQPVTGAVENNIAVFDANGKPVDGGKNLTQLTLTTSTYAVAFGTIQANGSALANVTLTIPSGYTIISIVAVTGTSMDNINYIGQYYSGKLYARAESKWPNDLTGQACTFRVTFLKV